MEKPLVLFIRSVLFSLLFALTVFSQVNVLNQPGIYEYLERFDARGFITINHHQKPFTRQETFKYLTEIRKRENQLTRVQKEELYFYLAEYNTGDTISGQSNTTFLARNSHGAFRFYEYNDTENLFVVVPDFGLGYTYRKSGQYSIDYYNGLALYGNIGRIFSFDFNFNDFSVRREGYPFQNILTSERGYDYPRYNRSIKTLNHDRTTAAVTASWDWGYVSLKKDYNYWGTGTTGKLILSDKAPSYPQLFLKIKPYDWVEFGYFYGELISSINDSSTIRNSGGTRAHIQLVDKYIAAHMLTFNILDNLKVSVGESVVISDRFEPIYLIPVIFFRLADHYVSHSDFNSGNAQVFGAISWRIPKAGTRIDFSLFIDELAITWKDGAKAIGYSVGISNYDFPVDNLSLHAEYVKTDPFVYSHSDPAQTYANRNYFMGHWIGNNSDLLNVTINYSAFPQVHVSSSLSYVRRGDFEDPAGPRYQDDQRFLYGNRSSILMYDFSIDYEIIHNVFVDTKFRWNNAWGKNNLLKLENFRFSELSLGVKTGFR